MDIWINRYFVQRKYAYHFGVLITLLSAYKRANEIINISNVDFFSKSAANCNDNFHKICMVTGSEIYLVTEVIYNKPQTEFSLFIRSKNKKQCYTDPMERNN
eukprot:133551_1